MDLADTRPAELAARAPAEIPDQSPDESLVEASPAPRRSRGGVLRRMLGVLVVLALITGAVVLALRARDDAARDDARQAAMQAARQEALNLTTIDYRTASHDLERIIAAATGGLRAQFAAQRAKFPDVLRNEKSVSTGNVLSSALVSLHGSQAQVMVAVDASVSNDQSSKAGTGAVVKHYRMVMKLQHTDGRWQVSDVAFAGLPQ